MDVGCFKNLIGCLQGIWGCDVS